MSSSVDIDLEARAIAAFKACCDVAPAELEAALDAACGDDLVLRQRVERLIAADVAAEQGQREVFSGGHGRQLILDDLVSAIAEGDDEAELLPETLGPYRVIALLGAGGMGLVYEAEQAAPKRRVAVKTVHPHLRTDAVVEHFRREVELLGALGHPAIPQAFEAGEEDGTVWLAMELVRGRRLLEHTVERPWRERIDLILEIIDGVVFAHDAGIVHCDLTPDNILVTASGQPKILDFGLALTTAGAARGLTASHDYVAPEQRVAGRGIDARVDVFALGRVLATVLANAPIHRAARRELDAIIARATALDPADRYRTARELGDDLRRFLALRPTRAHPGSVLHRLRLTLARNRPVVRAAAFVLAAAALVGLGAIVWGWVADHRVEAQARRRLDAVQRRVAELEAAGERDKADAAFHLYARMSDHLGTEALHDAWVWRAEREVTPNDRAVEAWAEAVTSATTRADELDALTHLADVFARTGQWTQLDHVLGRIDRIAYMGRTGVADTQELRFRTATYHRRLAEAAALRSRHPTAPIVAALAHGRHVTDQPQFVQPLRLHGKDLLLMRARESHRVRLVDPRADFTTVIETEIGARSTFHIPRALTGADGWLVGLDQDGQAILRHVEGGPELRAHMGSVHAAVGWTDQGLTAVLGSAGDERGVVSLQAAPPVSAVVVTRAPATVSAPTSDTDALLRGDLDGDGVEEIVMALGAWSAYDLRVFDVAADGAFELLARKRLGVVSGLALLPVSGQPPWIVATKVDRYPSVTTFGHATPYGPPAGVYLFAYAHGALEQRGFIPFPDGIGAVHIVHPPMVGDFDGDGLADLVVGITVDDGRVMLLMRQTSAGHLDPIVVRDVMPLAVVQADADAAHELFVTVEDDGAREGWVLGAGDDALPPLQGTSGTRFPVDDMPELDSADTALSRVWQGARTLRELGLLARAADNLEAASILVDSPALEALVLSEAASLRRELGASRAAAALFDRASARAEPGTREHLGALQGAAESWLAAIEPRLALERYRRLLDTPSALLPEVARAAETHVTDLAELVARDAPAQTFTWDRRVDAPLIVEAPASISRAVGGGIAVRTFSDQDVVARIPVTYAGGHLAIEVALELTHLEIGAGLRIELRPRGSTTAELSLLVEGRGGDQSILRLVVCGTSATNPRGTEGERPIDAPPEHMTLRLDHWSGRWPGATDTTSRTNCRLWTDSPEGPYHSVLGRPPLSPGEYDLVFASTRLTSLASLTEARFRISRLDLVGLTVAAYTPSPLERAHLAYANGDWEAARAQWAATSNAAPFTLLSDLQLADEHDLARSLAPRLIVEPRADPILAHALRTHWGRLAPLIARLDPARLAQWLSYSWGITMRYTAIADVREVIFDPALARLEPSSTEALWIIVTRADLFYRLGELERGYAAATLALTAKTDGPRAELLVAQAELLAARIAWARGDRELARTHLHRWRDRLPLPELARESLGVDPLDAALKTLL